MTGIARLAADTFGPNTATARWRTRTPGQQAAEIVVGGAVRIAILGPVVAIVAAAELAQELADRCPSPHVLADIARAHIAAHRR